jgi:methyltransferase (TIGR00027 family)
MEDVLKPNHSSTTAEIMALFRACETCQPANLRLFDDPFARGFLTPSLKAVAAVARVPVLRDLVNGMIDQAWPGARSSGIARTRLIDDLLVQALHDGIDQVVILGAGFDSRAYRTRDIERARVFEVDHPDTLGRKHQAILRMQGEIPANVTFVCVDFNRTGLADAMKETSFAVDRRTFFIWEGVTNYLTADAVDETLRFVGSTAPGSQIVFTYVDDKCLANPSTFGPNHNLRRLLERVGEPWSFGLDPVKLKGFLEERGLDLVQDLGSIEYRIKYNRVRRLPTTGYEFYRAAVAQVCSLQIQRS